MAEVEELQRGSVIRGVDVSPSVLAMPMENAGPRHCLCFGGCNSKVLGERGKGNNLGSEGLARAGWALEPREWLFQPDGAQELL